jgi:hypothetical protein
MFHPNIFFLIRKVSMEGQQSNPTLQQTLQPQYARLWKVSKTIYGKKVFLHRFFASQHINKSVYQILYL